jgi:hypothetical protein
MTASDFRNTYAVTGFCGIDVRTCPLHFYIHDDTNDSAVFSEEIERAIGQGFLKSGDVLVLENTAIHFGGVDDDLAHWLWSHHGVFLLALPTRSPELNPIELIWNILVQRLKAHPLAPVQGQPHAVAYASCHIMSEITHDDVAKCYKHCNYL